MTLPPTVSLGRAYQRMPGIARSWPRRLGCGVAALVLLAAVFLLGSSSGAHVLYALPVRVSGRVVDAVSGQPVAGVWIASMRTLSESGRESAILRMRWIEDAYEYGHESEYGALTGADGCFSFVFRASKCRFESSWSFWRKDVTLESFEGILGLLLTRAGQEYVVIDTHGGVWQDHPEEGILASLEMGDLRYGG